MEWMLDIQLVRRSLSPIQRFAVAEKYRPIYEKQAQENQLSGLNQNQNTVSQNFLKWTEPSEDTYSKLKKLDSGNEMFRENQSNSTNIIKA